VITTEVKLSQIKNLKFSCTIRIEGERDEKALPSIHFAMTGKPRRVAVKRNDQKTGSC
jgi:hypothetical protein